MKRFQAKSRCECQAILTADLNDQRFVLEGAASRHGLRERAPAHSIHTGSSHRFDVAWACPFCGRNTLRSFYDGGSPQPRG